MTTPLPTAPYTLARYRQGEDVRLGLVVGARIRPLDAEDLGAAGLNDFLAEPDWDRLARLAEAEGQWTPISEVTLVAPVAPRQVLQAGANYRSHVVQLIMGGLTARADDRSPEEIRAEAERIVDHRAASGRPFVFIGLPQCVVGDDEPLVLPAASDVHDWELELAAVIGREAFRVDADDALDHVAGYTIVNDITTRDLVFPGDVGDIGADWFRAKNSPGFLPTGPFLVPAPFVDPGDLDVRLELNGEVMQDATTAELIFDVAAIVSAASQTLPLLPGDLVLTGSPAGNGQHWKRFLRDGDVMTGTIAGLGTQTVRCRAETSGSLS
ncbi:2-keto-4-pentenoate hydratase/2-oxohepta-3-ene-1,7-dioic acid hydratase in catechol pathway [Brevibacterium sanguinis]|uniref:2-keto-4-pentenoate hydratase/2-oxohepta-3-ene-1,7-dioic acid hydratase in catechol pathway n=2 Tax=Brevibacterium TaxID=1696 RepID=A0A366IJY7_9MICO|nr:MULTISPECIES: fumarylacetoacetate hydrolase family protein [Brevibacterium]RBP65601.1 2-keto-4-pentenoate hydratase/2-oxohepta-3-ene-1,7-dioic acid hydratase in catechol pathway [Brevibacterium sanguinis]RBP72235.1 2-keto-4-pentenoate hydratase/2-oxohepta-3-ene-1,7-dioic acid hydratase in catechol pathway [Brevibacterium celere]